MLKIFSCLGLLVLRTEGHVSSPPASNFICNKVSGEHRVMCSDAQELLEFEESTNLLNITITSDDFQDLKNKALAVKAASDKIRIDPSLQQKAMLDVMALQETKEYKDLYSYVKLNQPPRDKKSRVWLQKVTQQTMKVQMAFMQMQKEQSSQMEQNRLYKYGAKGEVYYYFDNAGYQKFDKEYGLFLKYRKSFIKTPWGQGLKKRVEKLRATPQFKAVEQDWKATTQTKSAVQFTKKAEAFFDALLSDYKFGDKPEGFKDGPFVKQTFKLVQFVDDILNGKLQGVFDYVLADDE